MFSICIQGVSICFRDNFQMSSGCFLYVSYMFSGCCRRLGHDDFKSADPSGRRRVRAAAPNLCTLILQNPRSTLSAQNA